MATEQQVIERFRQVMTARGRARFGRFSIEGTRLVERALRAGWTITHAIYAPHFIDKPRHQTVLTELIETGCETTAVSAATLAPFTGERNLGGMMALVTLPPEPTHILAQKGLFAVAADVVDPGNIGALIRSAHGMGAAAFVAIGTSDPFHPKAVRTSMGSLFKLPIVRQPSLAAFAVHAQQHEIEVLGSVAENGVALPQLVCRPSVAVVLGGEYHGLTAAQQALCDQLVTIPMAAGIDSFSVSAAGAILFYGVRQHLGKG